MSFGRYDLWPSWSLFVAIMVIVCGHIVEPHNDYDNESGNTRIALLVAVGDPGTRVSCLFTRCRHL